VPFDEIALIIGRSRGCGATARQARTFASRARFARPALINGVVGAVVAPRGQLQLVQRFRVVDRKIVELEVIVDPERLSQLELAVLDA
jgi:RNA polymerase sigma-70 factor (ECF subfamily)